MSTLQTIPATEEEIVAELEQLGVRYLSRQHPTAGLEDRPRHLLMADLVRQPSSRVRMALIALLLAHPDYATSIPLAIQDLTPPAARPLKILYTAAVYLQHQYADRLQRFLGPDWRWLPDIFSEELGVSGDTPGKQLKSLGQIHAQASGMYLNWAGTYENVLRLLLRRWEMEEAWKQ